jgi:threonylcarbamoyladenosine tRNA methylthiotransferase MtaB
MQKVSVFNIGCKVNQYECDCIEAVLEQAGLETTNKLEMADFYVINSCAVTIEAERKSRQIVSRIRALKKDAIIIVTGCASKKNPDFYNKHGVYLVPSIKNKREVIEKIKDIITGKSDLLTPFSKTENNIYEEINCLPKFDRTRAYIKIQDGCNNYCTYCIIPYLRGESRSRKISNILLEVNNLLGKTLEIVFTGINLSSFGLDTNESLTELFISLKNIPIRIRLGSFYAEAINEDLLYAMSQLQSFCPHFHLSLQSGSNKILKDMNRKYSTELFAEKVRLIYKYFPLASITTDIIVGFPTENDDDFQNTLKFITEIGFSDLHIFPFSPREGTIAGEMKPISSNIINLRISLLNTLREKLNKEFLIKMLSLEQGVVFEETHGDIKVGYSQYYARVYCNTSKNYSLVKPTSIYKDGIIGEEIL